MSSALLARGVKVAQRRLGARQMSGHGSPEEIFQSKEMWLKTTTLALALVIIPYGAFTLYKEVTHPHAHKDLFPHMHKRIKAYPWGPSDCAMFDLQCRSGKADHDDHAEHH